MNRPCDPEPLPYPGPQAFFKDKSKDRQNYLSLAFSKLFGLNSKGAILAQESPESEPSPSSSPEPRCIYPTTVTRSESYVRNKQTLTSGTASAGRMNQYKGSSWSNTWNELTQIGTLVDSFGTYITYGPADLPDFGPRVEVSTRKGTFAYTVGGTSHTFTHNFNADLVATIPLTSETSFFGGPYDWEIEIAFSAVEQTYEPKYVPYVGDTKQCDGNGVCTKPLNCNLVGTNIFATTVPYNCVIFKTVSGKVGSIHKFPIPIYDHGRGYITYSASVAKIKQIKKPIY